MLVFIGTLVLLTIVFVLFYIIAATLLKWLPSTRHPQMTEEGIEIWVVSNGAHSDICLPIRSSVIDWAKFIDTSQFKPLDYHYISFGWGDKGFYLDTPSWAKLKPKTAFKALFKLSRTTMQVVLYNEIPEIKYVRSLRVSPEQYQNIVDYVKQSFQYTPDGQVMHIDFAGLPAYEHLNCNFYEAEGRYHFFKTCNCWVNSALKEADVRTATWAPFSKAIFHQLDKHPSVSEPIH